MVKAAVVNGWDVRPTIERIVACSSGRIVRNRHITRAQALIVLVVAAPIPMTPLLGTATPRMETLSKLVEFMV